jgi:hypothetical protein
MKILVVVDSINIEDSSGSKANVALISNLVEGGFEVLVYHYTRKNISLPGADCYAIAEIKYSPLYFLSRLQRVMARNFKIKMSPFFEKRMGFSFTFFNDTMSIVKAFKKCRFQPDIVLTLSKAGSFRPHNAVLQLPEWHAKWMAYVHDPYPFHFYPIPYRWIEPGYKLKETFFRKVSEKARYSAFPSQLLLEWMGNYYPYFIKTGIVIPHQNAKYQPKDSTLPNYFDVSKLNLLHAGNLLNTRSPKGLVEGLQLFFDKQPEAKKEVRLLLIGSSAGYTEMLDDYQRSMPQLYVQHEIMPFDSVYTLQQNATVNVIIEAKSEISPFLPAKFPHCVAANKMILSLAPRLSEVKRLLGDDYYYWAEADDALQIAIIIEKLYFLWMQNPANLLLNRIDLEEYLSADYLKETLYKSIDSTRK